MLHHIFIFFLSLLLFSKNVNNNTYKREERNVTIDFYLFLILSSRYYCLDIRVYVSFIILVSYQLLLTYLLNRVGSFKVGKLIPNNHNEWLYNILFINNNNNELYLLPLESILYVLYIC